MNNRLALHRILANLLQDTITILDPEEDDQVYFQPPATVKMAYPCIVYKRNRVDVDYADDDVYKSKKAYTITVIDPDPDSEIPDKVSQLPFSSFNTHFTTNNLNHDVYTVYF